MIVHCGGCRLGFDEAKSPRCPRCGGEPMNVGGDPISAESLSEVDGEAELEATSRSMPMPLALREPSSSTPLVAPTTSVAPSPPAAQAAPYSIQVVVNNQVHAPAPYPHPYPYPPPPPYPPPYPQPYGQPLAPYPYADGGTSEAFYPAPYVRRKDPGAATLLSCVVPGVGQMYNGQVRKGLGFLALTCVNVLLLFVGIGVFTGLVTWIWAMADAHNSAEKINRGQIVV